MLAIAAMTEIRRSFATCNAWQNGFDAFHSTKETKYDSSSLFTDDDFLDSVLADCTWVVSELLGSKNARLEIQERKYHESAQFPE